MEIADPTLNLIFLLQMGVGNKKFVSGLIFIA